MRFKIDGASLIIGSKFTVFTLFYFVFEGNLPCTSPRGGLYLEGLLHGGAYFRNFTVVLVFSFWFLTRICRTPKAEKFLNRVARLVKSTN